MKDFRLELTKDDNSIINNRLAITPDLDISIQAGEYNYSEPRENLRDNTRFTAFELGFPNFNPPEYIAAYAEEPDDLQGTVYAYVPYELIQKMIDELRGDS